MLTFSKHFLAFSQVWTIVDTFFLKRDTSTVSPATLILLLYD